MSGAAYRLLQVRYHDRKFSALRNLLDAGAGQRFGGLREALVSRAGGNVRAQGGPCVPRRERAGALRPSCNAQGAFSAEGWSKRPRLAAGFGCVLRRAARAVRGRLNARVLSRLFRPCARRADGGHRLACRRMRDAIRQFPRAGRRERRRAARNGRAIALRGGVSRRIRLSSCAERVPISCFACRAAWPERTG